jgi:hypothetical protein
MLSANTPRVYRVLARTVTARLRLEVYGAGMPRWNIPAPLPVDWPLRDVSTAAIEQRTLDDGRLEIRIEHAKLEGVTPAMMRWWISNLDQHLEWRGVRALAYRFWHPRDHVHFHISGTRRPDGTLETPAKFHLVEAFGAQRRFLVEQRFDLTQLDDTGFRLVGTNSTQQLEMHETFEPVPGGTRMVVQMRLGTPHGLLTPLAMGVVRKLKGAQLEAWKRHNVEEDGTLQYFLPELHAARQGVVAPAMT